MPQVARPIATANGKAKPRLTRTVSDIGAPEHFLAGLFPTARFVRAVDPNSLEG